MTRSVKRVVLVLLAAAVLAFAAWMLWPRSIGDAVDLEGEDFYGFLITLDVRDGQSQTDSESYTVSADSEQAEAILELLDQYTYHFCWDTLTGADVISEIGDIIVDLDASGDLERKLSVSNGTGKARVNGRVVRIGYFGSGQAAALCEQLSAILRGESGVAN